MAGTRCNIDPVRARPSTCSARDLSSSPRAGWRRIGSAEASGNARLWRPSITGNGDEVLARSRSASRDATGARCILRRPPPEPPRQLFLFLSARARPGVAGRPMPQQDLRAHADHHAGLVREGRSVAGGGYFAHGRRHGDRPRRRPGGGRGDAAPIRRSSTACLPPKSANGQPRFDSGRPLVEPAANRSRSSGRADRPSAARPARRACWRPS